MPRLSLLRGRAPEHPAFEELLAANLDALYGMSLRLCRGRKEDAEDLLQDSVLRAFVHRSELRDHRAGRSWLFTTLVRTHLNRVRAERRRNETAATDLGEREFEVALGEWQPGSDPVLDIERAATRQAVRAAIDALDRELRVVLLLTDVQDFSHRETAAMLELPEGTVASRLFRARKALRGMLAESQARQETRRTI